MNVTIAKEEMQKKLSDIQSIVETKSTMPILSHFILDIGKDGGTIYATDLETAIREPIDALEVKEEGRLCVPAKKLYEISREVVNDILIENEASEWIKLRSGKSNFRIACLNPDDYPQWPVIDETQRLTIHSKKLLHMIEKTIFCSGENDTRYTLNGVLFHIIGDKKKFIVVGTDGHRLASISTEIDVDSQEDIKVIVPRKSALELRKFLASLDEDVTFDITKNHILFVLKEKEFLTKLIEGTYPNYEQVVPKGNDKTLTLNREDFVSSLRRVSVMSKERSHAVKFDIADGELIITATDPELGEAQDRLSIEYKGEEVTFGFNARYILDVLAAMGSSEVVFELLDTISPTLLTEKGNEDYQCVVMPMRI